MVQDWLASAFKRLGEWINPHDYDIGITLDDNILRCLPTGSFYICNPQVVDTDKDYIILTKNVLLAHPTLQRLGYNLSVVDDNEYDLEVEGRFMCYRKGDINLIVTEDESFFDKFWQATCVAKQLNLKEKHDRIYLFKYVLYGTIEGE